MVYNKYIGIIGGTGTIGSIIVKYLLQLQTHFHVLIGGRRSIKEISMSTFYNSERLKYMHIPADTRSAFPVISVQSPVSIQCCWQS